MKHRLQITCFDLAVLGNRVRIELGEVASCVVSAQKISGTFANALAVKRYIDGVGAVDFATAQTLSAGGAVALSSGDLEACRVIEIAVVTNETGWAFIVIEVESETVPKVQ